uniref:Chromosome partition protein Smc n=1 Tax=Lygus hesperus TaxID=30085 RepID=A0A0A9ZD02_LYGHE
MILEEKATTSENTNRKDVQSAKEKVESVISEYLRLGDVHDKANATEFVERLEGLVSFIQNLQGPRNLYRMNNKAENDVAVDLQELDFLVTEMKTVNRNIGRLRSNKVDVHKELNFMKGALEKKTKEEIQEMETVIAIYDKELLKKWHVAKKTSSPHSLENFINNLAGKKQAIENVHKMALDRLATLKKTKPDGGMGAFHLRFGGSTIAALKTEDTDSDSDATYPMIFVPWSQKLFDVG